MRRSVALVFVLLAAGGILAGCVNAPEATQDANDDPAGPDTPGTLPWGLRDCAYVVAAIPVDEEALSGYLPEGFEPDGFSLLEGVEVGAVLGVEAFVCDEGATLNGTMRPMPYGSFFTGVTPPPALANESVDDTYVKWDVLVPDEDRRAVLKALGAPARDGNVQLSIVGEAGSPRSLEAELVLDGLGTFGFSGAINPASDQGEFTFTEYQPAEAGLVAWSGLASISGGAVGQGTVSLEPGSWPAQLVGAPVTPAILIVGSFTFDPARIELPP